MVQGGSGEVWQSAGPSNQPQSGRVKPHSDGGIAPLEPNERRHRASQAPCPVTQGFATPHAGDRQILAEETKRLSRGWRKRRQCTGTF